MDNTDKRGQEDRSDANLAQMIAQTAQAIQADVVLWATESGVMPPHLHHLSEQLRVIAATTDEQAYDALTQTGLEVIRLPLRAANKYSQIRYILSVAFRSAKVSSGDLVICAIGGSLYPGEGNLVVLTDVESSVENLGLADLIKLTDGIRPKALESAVTVACKIGRAARRGKRIGASFILGDSGKVLEGSKQLIPNPFHGHEDGLRRLTNPDIHTALVELSKLDGAFVVRGDGFIQTAGVFLTSAQTQIELPAGLGARHVAAAAVTERSAATAIVVSATDGNVRIFSGGKMVLQLDPTVAYGPITFDE